MSFLLLWRWGILVGAAGLLVASYVLLLRVSALVSAQICCKQTRHSTVEVPRVLRGV